MTPAEKNIQAQRLANAMLEGVQGMPLDVVLPAFIGCLAQTLRVIPTDDMREQCVHDVKRKLDGFVKLDRIEPPTN